MSKRLLRICLLLLGGCVGIGLAAWAVLRTMGFGSAVVVVANVGSSRVETLSIAEVSEGGRDLIVEHAPIRLGPGESTRVQLERRADAELLVLLTDAMGSVRRVSVHEYLSHGVELTIEIDIADGTVKHARVRRRTDTDFRNARWTSE